MTADDIRAAIADGARTVDEISEALGGVGTICELCHEAVSELLHEATEKSRPIEFSRQEKSPG